MQKLLVIVFLCCTVLISCSDNGKPNEAELYKNHVVHSAKLKELAAIVNKHPKLYRIDQNKTVPEPILAELDNPMIANMRSLMKTAGVTTIDRIDDELRFSTIYFKGKKQLGYSIIKHTPKYITSSIDNHKCLQQSIDYKAITDNWYMYVACEPE